MIVLNVMDEKNEWYVNSIFLFDILSFTLVCLVVVYS